MKKAYLIFSILLLTFQINAQPAGYYNGSEGKTGSALKDTLHKLIRGHIDYSYSQAKYLINYSDADPGNPNNVILFYTQRSQDADTYGTGPNDINREHVWAKSHGDFADLRPMDGDAFNLQPADGSVNILRSNRDFDECSATGAPVPDDEAPGTYYTTYQWEPTDAVKGQVARIIFYMSTRYEGTNSELDLEVVDAINTYPNPEHGKLSTLLQWNRDFPPTAFEYRRNERIFQSQKNRNPFIDNPGFADLIWGGASVPDIQIGEMSMAPALPFAGESTVISVNIQSVAALSGITLYWGSDYNSESNQVAMSGSGDTYSGTLSLTGFTADNYVYYKIAATDGTNTEVIRGSYHIPKNITAGQLTAIKDIQGTGSASPILGQTVTTAGIIVANFDNSIYIQDGKDQYSGLCVYGSMNVGRIGDSIVLTAKVAEYNNLTEMVPPYYSYVYSKDTEPQTIELTVSQIGEAYEGMLVIIKDVQFVEGGTYIPDGNNTYIFSDGTGSMPIFSRYGSRLVGHELPSGTINLTGIVSQYQADYQILVRDMSDFSAGNDIQAPEIVAVDVQSNEWLMVNFNEKLDITSAQITANYSLNNNITIVGAYLYENTHVSLNISGMESGTHTLTVNGVKDLSGNVMSNVTKEFTYTSTALPDLETGSISIYPNPADEILYMSIDALNTCSARIEILDLTGKVLISRTMELSQGSNHLEIITSELTYGLYLIKLQTGKNTIIQKLNIK